MIYFLNGQIIDSLKGNSSLGIKPGMDVPVKKGDVLEFGPNKIKFQRSGIFNMESSALIQQNRGG